MSSSPYCIAVTELREEEKGPGPDQMARWEAVKPPFGRGIVTHRVIAPSALVKRK